MNAETNPIETIDWNDKFQNALEAEADEESHLKEYPYRIHASQIGHCHRQAYLSKTGLKETAHLLGVFEMGNFIHSFIEERVAEHLSDDVEFERECNVRVIDGGGVPVEFRGRADCIDWKNKTVYDFKSRNGWYNWHPPIQRHIDQLYVYMVGLGVDYGQLVYISKGDLECREWPQDGVLHLDNARFNQLVGKARRIGDAIKENGVAESPDEIPFEKCGCFFCDEERLTFDALEEL